MILLKDGEYLKMRYAQHNKARAVFREIDTNPQNYLIIHYSCESFYDIKDGHTPRITSIAVYNYDTVQIDSFSIHKMAERANIEMAEIEHNYNKLEREMLDDFFEYAKEHKHYFWIHWNMRDMNYGFKAIEHRYSVLGGEPYKIPDTEKIDLARYLIDCYGESYASHPRMEKLLEQNNIVAKDYLNGAKEAEAFANQEYVKLHMSTLRKVNVFATILNRAINNTLEVNSKWTEIYGVSIQGILNYCKNTWWLQIIWTLLSIIFGSLIGKIIDNLL